MTTVADEIKTAVEEKNHSLLNELAAVLPPDWRVNGEPFAFTLARAGSPSAMKQFVARAGVPAPGSKGTLAHAAAASGDANTLKAAVELCPQVRSHDDRHRYPEDIFAEVPGRTREFGRRCVVEGMKKHVLDAVKSGDAFRLDMILECYGAELSEARFPLDRGPAHVAALTGQAAAVMEVLDRRNQPLGNKDFIGQTPRDIAEFMGSNEILAYLELRKHGDETLKL